MFSTGRKFRPASIFTRPYSSHPFLCALVQNYTGKYPEFFCICYCYDYALQGFPIDFQYIRRFMIITCNVSGGVQYLMQHSFIVLHLLTAHTHNVAKHWQHSYSRKSFLLMSGDLPHLPERSMKEQQPWTREGEEMM